MKPFFRRILICLVPVLLSALIVGMATNQYLKGEGGFKLGVDLVGGTILVYEIDQDKKLLDTSGQSDKASGDELAAALKRRIDPTDLYNVVIRPLSDTRVEIILPTGGAHQANIEEHNWQELLQGVQAEYPQLKDANLAVDRQQARRLPEVASQEIQRIAWTELLTQARAKWPDKLKDVKLEAIPVDKLTELNDALGKAGIDPEKELKPFIAANEKAY